MFATPLRLLTFRATSKELQSMDHRHLIVGLLLTWLVGVGRWWEDPRAGLLQHLGIGSLAYILALALFLWLILWPMCALHWKFLNVLTFVSLTAPPGLLYAIPVRHGFELQSAQGLRLLFLAIVAGWRVLLLAYYLGSCAGFSGGRLFVATLFPLTGIVFGLTALNLEKVVYRFMSGIEAHERSVNDSAFSALFLITMLSAIAFVPLCLGYLALSIQAIIRKYRRTPIPEEDRVRERGGCV